MSVLMMEAALIPAVAEYDGRARQYKKSKELPFRANIAEISSTAYSVPSDVSHQRAIETAMGEEINSMILTKKPIADVQAAIEQRVGKLLAGAN